MVQMTFLGEVLSSVQRALLGKVSPSLRGVHVETRPSGAVLRCFFDDPISKEDNEDMEIMFTEVTCDFPPDVVLALEIVATTQPLNLGNEAVRWAYLRRAEMSHE